MPNQFMQFAMAGAPGGATSGGAADPMAGLMSLLPLVLIFVLFYVLFIIPQRRQQKEHQAVLKNLKKGDQIVTTGGIFGSIIGFSEQDSIVQLKLGENVKIEIQRSAIAGLRKTGSTADKPAVIPK
jgi:preprotein translocase subunit YajC